MIKADINGSKIHFELSGEFTSVVMEGALTMAHILYGISERSNVPITVIAEGIGSVLPEMIKDIDERRCKNE